MLYLRQRGPSERAVNLGSWVDIMGIIANCSVGSNAVMLCHTTDTVSRLISTDTLRTLPAPMFGRISLPVAVAFRGPLGVAFSIDLCERAVIGACKRLTPDIPRGIREKINALPQRQRIFRSMPALQPSPSASPRLLRPTLKRAHFAHNDEDGVPVG